MRGWVVPAVRFVVVLLAGLALLGLVAFVGVTRTMRAWFERDLALSSELAAAGARQSLLAHWRAGDLIGRRRGARGPRDGRPDHGRRRLRWRRAPRGPQPRLPRRTDVLGAGPPRSAGGAPPGHVVGRRLGAGARAHVSAVPVAGDDVTGVLVLVHDLAFVDARQRQMRGFALLGVALLSLGASLVTLVAAASGGGTGRGAAPAGARRVVAPRLPAAAPGCSGTRHAHGRRAGRRGPGGLWTPERLKQTLSRSLHGERVLIVANREPYVDERLPDGSIVTRHPASGLVSALEPVMRACSGCGSPTGAAAPTTSTADGRGRCACRRAKASYVAPARVAHPQEEQGYYYGVRQRGPLAALPHRAHAASLPGDDWQQYQDVNRRFADAVWRRGRRRRPDRARAGLPLRAGARHDP